MLYREEECYIVDNLVSKIPSSLMTTPRLEVYARVKAMNIVRGSVVNYIDPNMSMREWGKVQEIYRFLDEIVLQEVRYVRM